MTASFPCIVPESCPRNVPTHSGGAVAGAVSGVNRGGFELPNVPAHFERGDHWRCDGHGCGGPVQVSRKTGRGWTVRLAVGRARDEHP
ncbi:hypothetical protein NOCA2270171 [metagenome]|uniref:Uncharacterized protein n=1 Tax=metagenome TaxID=256318 RepID=A0A2P2C0M4_9ZZZZ